MKNIIGLDLGTNSIGWAWIQHEEKEKSATNDKFLIPTGRIIKTGCRIIPMDAEMIGNFDKGNSISQTSQRTKARIARRLKTRFKSRRERLNRLLRLTGFLPEHYAAQLDGYGKISDHQEPRIPWLTTTEGQCQFLFKPAYKEMLELFRQKHPEIKSVPYDWTIYYLRRKALTEKITGEELAWILHSFNHKRGYNQSRDEVEETDNNKTVEYFKTKVKEISSTGETSKGKNIYKVTFENGVEHLVTAKERPQWEGTVREIVVTTLLNAQKDGSPKVTTRMPKDDDWQLIKTRTQDLIKKENLTVGEFIFKALLDDPSQKIIGELVRTIDRNFYIDELQKILRHQEKSHPELTDRTLYKQCVEALYPSNEAHRRNVEAWSMSHFIVKDILFYQRPLKSKKSLIAECPLESRTFQDEQGNLHRTGIKCIPRSHPAYQEFRLWQFLANLRIVQRQSHEDGHQLTDIDRSTEILNEEALVKLFNHLRNVKEINQKNLLKLLGLKEEDYRWNYVEDKTYPMGETRYQLISRLKKAGLSNEVPDDKMEEALWHLLYSISDYAELQRALSTFARKRGWDAEAFRKAFEKCPPFKKDYGAYSLKAIRKLLPLMRRGSHWHETAISPDVYQRIEHFVSGEEDTAISLHVRQIVAEEGLQNISQFSGLAPWLAAYVAYGRHSEATDAQKWETPEELAEYISKFRQHSLRNPVVEQVALETMRIVHDLWQEMGSIDEIHVEIGRDMKQTAAERKKAHDRNLQNEAINLRIKALLTEFMNPEMEIKDVRPYSPRQQTLLHIYEEGAFEKARHDNDAELEEMNNIIDKFRQTDSQKRPTRAEIHRYRLWLDQKYVSPYTKRPIPLAKLFTTAYEVEHIIPRARYFDDSYNNKVICEAEINKLKDKMLGFEFIKKHGGGTVNCQGREVRILTPDEYTCLVEEHFCRNPRKKKNLLSEEIPAQFTARQLNDSRYIARFVVGILSNIVREKDAKGRLEPESTSKNVIVCTGKVTDWLKRDWGLQDVWNHIIYSRFERLNDKVKSKRFGQWENKKGKRVFQINMPLELQAGFSRKRIDHRHHAMDAIVIACASRPIINYLNNCSSGEKEHYGLRENLCTGKSRFIKKPWSTFTQDTEEALRDIVVSIKKNLRVITKSTNFYQRYDPKTDKKIFVRQTRGDHFAIRKSLHKDTVYGEVNLQKTGEVKLKEAIKQPGRIVDKTLRQKIRELKRLPNYSDTLIEKFFLQNADPIWKNYDFKKIKVRQFSKDKEATRQVATRKPLDQNFNQKNIADITDTGIQKILFRHLEKYAGKSEEAFSPDGLKALNENIRELNDGKPHHPIKKVRVAEKLGLKFPIGTRGNRKMKFVVADKDTNLFFVVYQREDGKRSYATIPLKEAIERAKQNLPPAPETDEAGRRLQFILSPNDLVYLPTKEELNDEVREEHIDVSRIYKMVSATRQQCFFIPHHIAGIIAPGEEYNAKNKIEISDDGLNIKEHCILLKTDRLGRYKLKK